MRNSSYSDLFGYTGKLLRVDLSKDKISVEEISHETLRKFMGGVGYGVKFLSDELPAGTNPLDPESKVIFTTGPFTGTGAPGSGFHEICFKSPLTGIWAETRSGGEWGGALRKAGYDFLALEGKAKEPKYIVIRDSNVEIMPAGKLKGKTTTEKSQIIRSDLKDEKLEILTIGQAGENLVRYANVMCGGRAAGRCGGGAVMGSKNLMAIAVKGTGKIPVANPEEFSAICKEGYQKALEQSATAEGMSFTETGTTGFMMTADPKGDWPTKNSRSNSWGKGKKFYEHFKEFNFTKPNPCYKGCVLKCGRICKVNSGKWATPQHEGAEYETISAFTAFVMNEDVDAAVHAGYLCNEYGIDTISTGASIAFAMDCYENGIISKEEADGLELTWGNTEVMIALVKKIANGDGIGRILGEGVRRASETIGKGSDKLAIHVKGLETPAHDARGAKLQAITYATGNRGMCHTHSAEGLVYDHVKMDLGLMPYGIPDPHTIDRFSEKGKGSIAKTLQNFEILPDILGFCRFYTYFNGLTVDDLARMTSLLTGWEIDGIELLALGERVFNLQRMFNVREGITKSDDMLPERCLKLPEFGDYSSVKECEIKDQVRMLEDYYEARGWNKETGIPLDREI